MADGDADTFLHVSRPEIDLPADVDPHAEQVHRQGRARLVELVRRGLLARDAQPAYYLYRQRRDGREQTGVVACVSVADYASGVIRTHELTRPDKEGDRARHIEVLDAHDEPVFLMAPASPPVAAVVTEVTATVPEYAFSTDDGVEHTFWVVDAPRHVSGLHAGFADLPRLYVADGHHRSAAAARVHQLRRSLSGAAADGSHDVFPAVIFPTEELQILSYNRAVTDLAGHSAERLLEALGRDFTVRPLPGPPQVSHRHTLAMYLAGHWHELRARPGRVDGSDPIAGLDVSLLQDRVLGPLLGIGDPRTDARLRFVGGIRGHGELVRLVDGGAAAVAFSLHPTSTGELLEVADRGLVMPPKSTWFEPKLRSGLFVHEIRPVPAA